MSQAYGITALVLGLITAVGTLAWALRSRGLGRRPLLVLLWVLGLLPALLELLVWGRLLDFPFVRFQRPLLAFPLAVLVAAVALRLIQLPGRLSAARRHCLESFTATAVLLSALSTLGLELGRPLDRLTVVIAIDRSRSIDLVPGAATRIENELRVAELGMRDDDRIAVVAFGASAVVEDPIRPKTRLPSPQRADVPKDGTDLAAAIRQSLSEIPPDSTGRVVLLSDGVATRGDTTEAALAASALGVPVDAVALDQGKIPDIRIASVRTAPRAAEGEPLELRVVTESEQDAEIQLRVYRDGELIRSGPTRIQRGQDLVYLRELAPGPGLHRYDVELSASDPAADRALEDNTGSTFVRVRGPSSALVLDSDPALAFAMQNALRSSAFQVKTAGPMAVPADLAQWAAYDLVVLGDIAASDLTSSQLEAIRSYVRDLGGGLLLMGGDHAMGPGGYARTPVEEVSPVSFDLKQERRRASLAEVIAVDYSGSMAMSVGQQTKLDLANEAAARSADLLGAGDRLGVMHVDTAVRWTVPLGPVADKAEIMGRIRKVGPGGGGIFIDLSLSAAYQALRGENVQLKHLLLFSDGSDAEEHQNALSLTTQAKRNGITTSVVALGNGSDVPMLSRLAELGGGRFYLIEDATRLPAVFAQETILASRSAINETRFVPRATGQGPVLRGIDWSKAPELSGYVVTLPKARAQQLLVGPEQDPILATWSVGLGRAGAFTSDYKDRWGSAWTQWEGAARLFAQLGRDLSRRQDDPRVRWEADATAGELSLNAYVQDDRGRHDTLRRLRARVAGPDGFSRELILEASGAGSYSGKIPLSRPGAYLAALVDDELGQTLATTGAALSAGEELRPTGTDRGELRRIATLTSGKLRDTLAGVFRERDRKRYAYAPLSSWLLTLAASALLLAVASRRLRLPKLGEVVRLRRAKPRPSSAGNAESQPAAGTLEQLRRSRERRKPSEQPQASEAHAPANPPAVATYPPQTPSGLPQKPLASPPAEAPRATARRQPGERTKSAAEILLERRRSRSPK